MPKESKEKKTDTEVSGQMQQVVTPHKMSDILEADNSCYFCGSEICRHGSVSIKGNLYTCNRCGESNIGGYPDIYCLPMYEGEVNFSSETYSTVCKKCHDIHAG